MSVGKNGAGERDRLSGPEAAGLKCWLDQNVPGFEGPLTVERFNGGQSNPTYRLSTPAGAYVLRRKPPGPLLNGAHAIDREARVMTALAGAGFPVPRVLGVCMDESVVGAEFYVMEMVEGRIFWDSTLPTLSPGDRAACFEAMNTTIAHLHALKPREVGLGDYGRPHGYLGRQLSRWSEQYLADDLAGRDSHMDRLVEWLPEHIPPDEETAIVHGDYRCDNIIFHPTEPRVLAVLDWELSTLGHPLSDFAYHLMMYRLAPTFIGGFAGADLQALNIPPEAEYIAAYCRRTHRERIPNLGFHLIFNMFRLAAILHGIKGRVARGTAASDKALDMAAKMAPLAEFAWSQAAAHKESTQQ